jgi:hypothetical protein
LKASTIRLVSTRGHNYGEVKEPEDYGMLLRFLPRRHVEIRAYINQLKYEIKRLMIWYNKLPAILEDMHKKELRIRELEREIASMQKRMKKAMGV